MGWTKKNQCAAALFFIHTRIITRLDSSMIVGPLIMAWNGMDGMGMLLEFISRLRFGFMDLF